MSRRKLLFPVVVLALGLVAAAPAFARTSGDSIWIITGTSAASSSTTTVSYGSTFMAGYTSKASSPWGHAQCWANSTTRLASPTSGPILDEYRAVQSNGTIGMLQMSDPLNQEWLGGGATCTLSLVAFQGSKMNVLATTNFTVTG